jgi:predicted transcriptional regulator
MTDSAPQPTTIEELEWAVWPSFALVAGIRLDLFTPLKDGPLSAEQLADKLGVEADKLKPLLCALAAAGLLKVEMVFSLTPAKRIVFWFAVYLPTGAENMKCF